MPKKRRNEGKESVFVYQMERSEAYLLLRLLMETTGKKRVSGVQKAFYEPETYKHHEKLLKTLAKKKYAEMKDGGLMITADLKDNFNRMLDSVHCLAFQNAELMNSKSTLVFYYADGKYVGFLQTPKKVILAAHEDPEAIYHVFAQHFDADGLSEHFRMENWLTLWRGKQSGQRELTGPMAKTLEKPVREAVLLHTGNRLGRTDFSVSMLSDGKQIHMIRGFADSKFEELDRGVMPVSFWHRIIVTELERLKDEHHYRCKIKVEKPEEEEEIPLSDYQVITSSPGFPKSRIGFLFWTLKCLVKGIPVMIQKAVKSKFVGAIVAAVWALILFIYNMYITCYFNDTFMLERRARLGNLSPYLMGGTLITPNQLKGFDVDMGKIETTFLVAPMMMLLTFLGRHLFLQFKERKFGFFSDFFGLFKTAKGDRLNGFGTGKTVWFIMAFTFVVGFLMMNPISLFLTAFYALLIYAQGKKNMLIQYMMMYTCAASRKKVDAGKKAEPDFRAINMLFYQFGCGMFLYGIVSVILWFIADYSFWIRALVTLLMVIFAMIQACMPGLLSGKRAKALAGIALFLTTAFVLSRWMPGGMVLADDGGISESGGTLLGLIQNAGFSTILGITLMTLGIALGGPAGAMIAAGCIAGGTNFVIGLTDTKAGEYVRKSARQFFNEPAPGEDYTILCTATKLGSFIAGFINPAAGAGTGTVKALQVGKLITDGISVLDSSADLGNSILDYANGEGSFGDVAWNALGLGLDMYGMSKDMNSTFDEWAKMKTQGDAYKYAPDPEFGKKIDDIQSKREDALQKSEDFYDRKRGEMFESDKVLNDYNREISGYEQEIRKVESGEVKPPTGMTKDEYIDRLKGYQDEATWGLTNRGEEIREGLEKDAKKAARKINKDFDGQIAKEYVDQGMDWGSKAYEADELRNDYLVEKQEGDAAGTGEAINESVKDTGKESANESAKGTDKEPANEPVKGTGKESANQAVKDAGKESVNESAKDAVKGSPEHSPQEIENDSTQEPARNSTEESKTDKK